MHLIRLLIVVSYKSTKAFPYHYGGKITQFFESKIWEKSQFDPYALVDVKIIIYFSICSIKLSRAFYV